MNGEEPRGRLMVLSVVVVTILTSLGYLVFFAFKNVGQRFLGETPLLFSTILLAVALYRKLGWARPISVFVFLLSLLVNLAAGVILVVVGQPGWFLLVIAAAHTYCFWVVGFCRPAALYLRYQPYQDGL